MTHSLSSYLYNIARDPSDVRLMHQMREQDETPAPTDPRFPRVALVVGPSPFTMMRGWEYYLTAPYEGVSYISTVLANAGYPVRIVDVRYAEDPVAAAAREVGEGADVVGIATFEDNFPFVRELIERVKAASPSTPVVCGGSLVTSVPHVFMQATKMDIAVISEGELTILDLMEHFRRDGWANSLQDIRGIWYRDADGNAQRNAPRGQMESLDFLPRMRLDLWPQAKTKMGLQPQIITSFSRGCKMDCSFCYRTTPQVAVKSPERFERELKWLKEQYGITFAFFADLTFNAVKASALQLCDILKDYNIRWTCMTRCMDVDPEQLSAMKTAGCDIALFGVESLGADALKEARKPTTENISVRAMRQSIDAGVRFGGLLIVGLPGETEESLAHMVAWAEEFNQVTRVKYLSAIPGTTVYQKTLESGFIKSEVDHLNWLSIEQALHEDEFLNVSGLPESKIRDAYRRIYDCYLPGPVMEFDHFPEHFLYINPSSYDGVQSSVEYAGPGWRSKFSLAGPHLIPGSERFTLDRCGTEKAAEAGAKLVQCGAKRMNNTQRAEVEATYV